MNFKILKRADADGNEGRKLFGETTSCRVRENEKLIYRFDTNMLS